MEIGVLSCGKLYASSLVIRSAQLGAEAEIERYLRYYVGRELTEDERRFYYGFILISAFYWFGWGLYKGSVGDDDSFFFLPAYRNLVRFIDQALQSYGLSSVSCKMPKT